jgi:hypothetical protein
MSEGSVGFCTRGGEMTSRLNFFFFFGNVI